MIDFEVAKTMLMQGEDIPYRKCRICKYHMSFTMMQYLPHIMSCKCRPSGKPSLYGFTGWTEFREFIESDYFKGIK